MTHRTFLARRAMLAASLVLALAGGTAAQTRAAAPAVPAWQHDAVPFYDTTHALQSLYAHWGLPRSREFAAAAQALPMALRALCEAPASAGSGAPPALEPARNAWRTAMLAWERLGAVAVGPVIARRTQRQIDFAPTRPQLIERAIKAQPQGAQAFERIGTPAKGLPALEWLLWTQPAAPRSPACAYAIEVALDVEREAAALQSAFEGAAATDWGAEEEQERSTQAMGEFINQWVGGIERLRWAHMEKPLRAAQGTRAPDYPRMASGLASAAWAAEWAALRALTVQAAGTPLAAPGQGLVPLETYLRGRGLNPLADRLRATALRIDAAMAAAEKAGTAQGGPQVLQAAKELSALKRLAEAEVAPALQVSIGFSDADGD
ncbi:imelysin family protein [Acidovorax sp. GBBC 3334]|uniref:imelysin family protein n=1 Tax=Acidovorax sp. GBBC 3334 TaxID=2940496 RepID=UPI0023029179|nr:imelysin family protein [Acidovorax sp. GBBC 3334]MDA8454758.1 imelysin family protein [Acidovorax sp. GBBC 3334]